MKSVPASRINNSRARTSAAGGFTFFELAVVASVIATLSAFLLDRIDRVQQRAGVAGAERLVGYMRHALQMRVAKLIVTHREDMLSGITEENPMDWLAEKPANYSGEYYTPDIKEIPDGNWYFDRNAKTLVYVTKTRKILGYRQSNLLRINVKLRGLHSNRPMATELPGSYTGAVLDQETVVVAVNR